MRVLARLFNIHGPFGGPLSNNERPILPVFLVRSQFVLINFWRGGRFAGKGTDMLRITHRHFIAVVASLSIGLSGFSASAAHAGSRDTERALAAIAGLAVIGAIIASERKKERRRAKARHQNHVEPRPLPRRINRKLLPQQCLRSFGEGDQRIRLFGARCMDRHYAYVDELPLRCERRVRTDRGIRQGYAVRCLKRQGYQMARR